MLLKLLLIDGVLSNEMSYACFCFLTEMALATPYVRGAEILLLNKKSLFKLKARMCFPSKNEKLVLQLNLKQMFYEFNRNVSII